MKKSELKKYIKETIIAELAEDMKGAVELPPNTSPSAIKKYTDQNIDVELVKEIGTDPSASKVEDAIKSGKIDPKEVEAAAKKAMNGDSTDLALMLVPQQLMIFKKILNLLLLKTKPLLLIH